MKRPSKTLDADYRMERLLFMHLFIIKPFHPLARGDRGWTLTGPVFPWLSMSIPSSSVFLPPCRRRHSRASSTAWGFRP